MAALTILALSETSTRSWKKNMTKIDNDLEVFLRPLSEDEFATLEKSCLSEGIRDKIVVWDEEDTLIDGHHRFKIASKHSLEFEEQRLSFPDKTAVYRWMLNNQSGRRNYTRKELTEIAVKLTKMGLDQVTAAKTTGVSRSTVQRGVQRDALVDSLPDDVKVKVRGINASLESVEALTKLPEDAQVAAVEIATEKCVPLPQAIEAATTDQPVSEELPFMETAKSWPAVFSHLRDVRSWVNETMVLEGGELLSDRAPKVVGMLSDIANMLKSAKPHALCPYCKGAADDMVDSCRACHGRGWVQRSVYDSAPDEKKQ